MSREYGCRVWNGEQYISPDYVDREGVLHWKENSIPSSSKDIEWFTGLRDSKCTEEYPEGQKIYEGDWLQDEDGHISLVVWDGSDLKFENIDQCEAQEYLKTGEVEPAYIASNVFVESKIIGNIHENPELLK
jgi:hypothetical protein